MSGRLLSVALNREEDVVAARQRARQIAKLLGFEAQDQTRIATAVSEIARNAHRYGARGMVEFGLEGEHAPQLFVIRIADKGPGIRDLQQILDGRYTSDTGMGLGIQGSMRLMDQCDIRSRADEGTEVVMRKVLPSRAPFFSGERQLELAATLAASRPGNALQELGEQNRELVRALAELRDRHEELERLNRELEDTNRGVVALYAELDERADHLRRADEMKSRFLSNMSHEFRTPLNSIRALARLLLGRLDGPLTDEQAKQVALISNATEDLSGLVDDLLDLAKISAGKTEVRPSQFGLAELFGMLRSMLRPLLAGDAVALHFEDVAALPPLNSDEAKVSQILRNLISNALKFTERGEVQVSATLPDADHICISVRDTGIGIAAEDRERIFEEFAQIAGPLQRKAKGTGLGLPLSRRLAKLLGGTLEVESELGAGSTFRLTLPLRYQAAPSEANENVPQPQAGAGPGQLEILFVDADADALEGYQRMLDGTAYHALPARSIRQARHVLRSAKPAAVVVDVDLPDEPGWAWIGELKRDPPTSGIPIVVLSRRDDPGKATTLGADACLSRASAAVQLLPQLDALTAARVLIIDDDPAARYTVRRFLGPGVTVVEAEDGVDGLRAAARLRPNLILLDLQLPDLHGGEVLRQLRSSPTTLAIPVAVITSLDLDPDARRALERQNASVLSKREWSGEGMSELLRRTLAERREAEV